LEGNLSRHQIVRQTEQEVVRRSCDVKRKIILLKISEFPYICVDFNRHILDVEVLVPIHPAINDMVMFKN